MGIVRIPLHSRKQPGLFAIVDEADAERVLAYRWHPTFTPHTTYADCTVTLGNGKYQTVRMHRLITNAPPGTQVDHVNHDGLDNRRENLSVGTRAENLQNHRGAYRTSKTGFIGVHPLRGHFQATVQVNKTVHYVGFFDTAEEAARARDAFVRERFPDARITRNFPDEEAA